jgi:hypothetical protein
MMQPASDNFVAVTTASTELIAGSMRRSALILFPPAGVTVTITMRGPAVLNSGPTWSNPTYPIILNKERFGSWCQQQLFIIASQAFTMGFVEIFDLDLPATMSPLDPDTFPMGTRG